MKARDGDSLSSDNEDYVDNKVSAYNDALDMGMNDAEYDDDKHIQVQQI